MKINKTQLFVLVASIICYTACKTPNNKEKSTADSLKKDSSKALVVKEPKRDIPQDKKYNQIARFIAGLQQLENDGLKEYESTDAWKSYSKESQAKWTKLKEGKIAQMRAFANTELKEIDQQGGLLFYPFSGADFLHAQTFFPNMDETIMIGLEPIGTPLDVEKISKKQTNYFSSLNRAGYFLADFSFFRTNDMAVDLTGKRSVEVDGTIHLIMLYLSQLDNEITYYEKVAINNDGKVVPANEYKVSDTEKPIYGTRLYFKRKGDDKIRILNYYSVNIADEGLDKKPEFKKYLQNLKPTVTYLKAASYLMYSVESPGKNFNFKVVRDVILTQSKYVLQDDSGMPLYNFPNEKWQKTFFGVYAGPISLFSNRYQTAMREAYKNKDNTIKDLPFGIGYQFRKGSSNLMLAKKIAEVNAQDLALKTSPKKEEKEAGNEKDEKATTKPERKK